MSDVFGIAGQIDNLVQQYRLSISSPAKRLENQRTSLNARMSALSELRSKLSALHTLAKELKATGTSSKFNVFAAESSLPTILTATAVSSASAGTHTLLVTQLAKADTILSSQLSASSTGIAGAEGAGTKSFTVTVNGTTTTVNVDIEDGEANSSVLSKMAAAVNASGASVTASVVADTSGTRRLVFTSKVTGSTEAVSMADVSGTLLSSIGLGAGVISGRTASTATTGGFLYSSTSLLDARFKVNGIDITRGTNSVSDVLTGVTLELKGVQAESDTPVTLTVRSDTAKLKSTLEDFMKLYNDALTFVQSRTSVNAESRTREIFASDQVFKNLRLDLRSLVSGAVSGVQAGNPTVLSDIGITIASNGTLSFGDVAKFEDAIASNVRKVSDLFNVADGIAVRLSALLEPFTAIGGQLDISQNGTRDQISNIRSALERTNKQIDLKVKAFRAQFESLQSTLNRINAQSQAISRITTQLYGY